MSTVTITDVAKRVGVSVATISRYLSGFTVRNQEQIREAIIELNKVRNRANLADTPAVSPADVKLAIWKERRVELAFEHDRYFDLVRTGQAQQAFAAHGKEFVVGKHELFPIPQVEIDLAGGNWSQNPGY